MVTEAAVAVNTALDAPDATVTVVGRVTAVLLLERTVLNPSLGAAAFSVTVQRSVPDPVREALVQESALTAGMPVPLRPTTEVEPVEELVEMVSCPAADPDASGLNCTLSVAAWDGFKVTGNVVPEMVKLSPVSATALMVNGALPVEVMVTDCVAGVFTATFPNERAVGLMPSVALAAFNCREKAFELPFAFAVRVAVWAVPTDDTVAAKLAVAAPGATVTAAGSVTAALVLDRVTTCPPFGAGAFKLTLQASVVAPVMDALLQESALTTAMPVPLSPMTEVGLPDELLVTVN